MIKRYQDFLIEKLNESKNKLVCPHCGEEINLTEANFLEKFDHLIHLLQNEYYSFSYIVSSNKTNIELGPFIKEAGLTWEEIKKNKLLIFDNLDRYDSINGGVDYLLYLLDEKYILGGFLNDLDSNLDELCVKYNYGYHFNTYGEKYILQCFESMEDYFGLIIENIIYMLYIADSSKFNSNYFDIQSGEIGNIQSGVITKNGDSWYLDFDKLYNNLMGHFESNIDNKYGDDHVDKVFNIIRDDIKNFFKMEIEEDIIEVDEEGDYIKISYKN